MPADDAEREGPAKYRDIADKLRGIAREIRFDHRRVSQLHALADGFDRLAERLERATADSN